MAWIWTVTKRLLLSGSVLLFGLMLAVESGGHAEDIVRGSFILGAVVALFAEWVLVDRRLDAYEQAFTTYGQDAPPRWERLSHSGWVFGGLVVALLPLQCSRALDAADPWQVVLGGTFWLACVCALWWTVVLGGITWLRFRLRGRLLPAEARPGGGVPAPFAVAALMAPGLLFGIWGTSGVAVATGVLTSSTTADDPRIELLVELGPDDNVSDIGTTLWMFGASSQKAFPRIDPGEDGDLAQTQIVTVPASTAVALFSALRAQPQHVDHIELNAAIEPSDDGTSSSCSPAVQFPLPTYVSNPAVVGVVDTGVDSSHPGLRGVVKNSGSDSRGHGTAVAGLAAGPWTSPNVGGFAVSVRSYPALASPRAAVDDVVAAIDDAVDDGVDVINLSFGAVGPPPHVLVEAVEYARREGVLVVAAAGNRGPEGLASEQWPANAAGVWVVGATDAHGRELSSSSRLDGVNGVLVPGDGLCTTSAGGTYSRVTGTSFAAARLSGTVASWKARGCVSDLQVAYLGTPGMELDVLAASCR